MLLKFILCAWLGLAASALCAQTLLLHYDFNQTGEPGTVTDRSASNRDGVLSGVAKLGAEGTGVSQENTDRALDNTAAQMGGNPGDAGGQVLAPGWLGNHASFTISLWFKTDGKQSLGGSARLFDTCDRNFLLAGAGNGELHFNHLSEHLAGSGFYPLLASQDEWIFVAVTYDGSGQTHGAVNIYGGSATQPVSLLASGKSGKVNGVKSLRDLVFGANGNLSRSLDGWLDNIRVYGERAGSQGALSLDALETVRLADLNKIDEPPQKASVVATSEAADKPRIKERIFISDVWSGHPVGFALLSDAPTNRQYAAYYDTGRNMVVASRNLDSKEWTKKVLPSQVGWDSHNYITIVLDCAGQLHVVGNLHVSPLVYFRTRIPGDVLSLEQIPSMTGLREDQMTYPKFLKDKDGQLLFSYRDGRSGDGVDFYNRYDEKTRTWSRLIDTPLLDGKGVRNAYPDGPKLGPDGYWHLVWGWRETRMAETNHSVSYARSRDLKNWETVDGKPVPLPLTFDTPGLILDPVPVNGGNLNGRLGFDEQGRVIVAYHKFDEKGATQMYLARAENGRWNIRQLTHWTYRWELKGGGSIPADVGYSDVRFDPKLGLYISLRNVKHGNGLWKINSETLELGEQIPSVQEPGNLPGEIWRGVRAPLQVNIGPEVGITPAGLRYVMRWETLPANRDRPRQGPLPEPSKLEVIVVEGWSASSR